MTVAAAVAAAGDVEEDDFEEEGWDILGCKEEEDEVEAKTRDCPDR